MECPESPRSIGPVVNSRISFAPGTNFDGNLRHNLADIAATSTYTLKPMNEKKASIRRYTKFSPPAATTLSMPYVTTNGLDYRDPTIYIRQPRNHVPKWFFRSKSDLLVDDREIEELLRQGSKSPAYIGRSHIRPKSDVLSNATRGHEQFLRQMMGSRRNSARHYSGRSMVPAHRVEVHTLGEDSYVNDPKYKPLVGHTNDRVIQNASIKPKQRPLKAAIKTENGQPPKHHKHNYNRTVRFTDSINVLPRGPPMCLDRGSILRPHDARISTDESYRIQRRMLQRTGTEIFGPKFDSLPSRHFRGQREMTSLDSMSKLMERTYEKQAIAKELLKREAH